MKHFENVARLSRLKRNQLNLSQAEVWQQVIPGGNNQALSNIERAKCTIPVSRAKRFCEVLGITNEEFSNAWLVDRKLEIDEVLK